MKGKSFEQDEADRATAMDLIEGRQGPGSLNEPPERKRAIYGVFEARDARFDGKAFSVPTRGTAINPADWLSR